MRNTDASRTRACTYLSLLLPLHAVSSSRGSRDSVHRGRPRRLRLAVSVQRRGVGASGVAVEDFPYQRCALLLRVLVEPRPGGGPTFAYPFEHVLYYFYCVSGVVCIPPCLPQTVVAIAHEVLLGHAVGTANGEKSRGHPDDTAVA